MMRRKLLVGGAAVGIGQVIGQGLSFLRTVIVTRLISPADYGIAATFVITVSLMEMVSDLNMGTLLIQSPDGDDPELQNSAHSLALTRGVLNAVVLFLLSWPLSALFGVPQARWAFQCLALYPVLRSAMHLDMYRMQREMRFMPSVSVEVVSQLIAVSAAWPLAAWLHDYSALLWLMLIQWAASSVASYIVAERQYGLAWTRGYIRRMLSFGWPLLVNGVLMFVMMQGDRLVIGSSPRFFPAAKYTLADLGMYSVAVTLGAAGLAALTKITLSLMLPALAGVQQLPAEFKKRYAVFTQALAIIGGLMAVIFVVAGKSLILLIYGQKYAAAGAFVGWLGAMQAVRVIRTGPTMAALAKGDSQNSLVANIARSSGLLTAIIIAMFGGPLTWMAMGGFGAEVLALIASAWRLQKQHGLSAGISLQPACLAAGAMAASCIVMSAGADKFGWLGICVTTAVIAGLLVLVWAAVLPPELRAKALPAQLFLRRQPSGPES